MTSAGSALSHPAVPRNWAATMLVVVSAIALVFSLMLDLRGSLGALGGPIPLLLTTLNYLVAPLLLVVSGIALAFGTRRFDAVPGRAVASRVALLLWAIFTAAAQLAFLGELTDSATTLARVETVRVAIVILAVVAGIGAAILVARAHVAVGFARASLFIAVLLFALTEAVFELPSIGVGGSSGATASFSADVWDLPRLAGLILLGISYWRTGAREAEAAK